METPGVEESEGGTSGVMPEAKQDREGAGISPGCDK